MLPIDSNYRPYKTSLFDSLRGLLIDGLAPDEILTPTREQVVDLVEWIETEFYIEELAGPIVLGPHQRAALREALRRDDEGKFVYDLVLWSDIAKSAKSTIAAGIVLGRAFHKPNGKFRVVASDLKQAQSRVFEFIKVAIRLNKRLKDRAVVNTLVITLDNGARIEAVPVDPDGEAGGADDMVEFTELHTYRTAKQSRMWEETKLSPLKKGYSQRWIDTYAGFKGESVVLEKLYKQLVKPENLLPGEYPLYARGAMFALWNCVPRLPWQTPEYYDSERLTLTEAAFNRIHGNIWSSADQAFIDITWWDLCKVDELPPIGRFKEIVVALDAAVRDDCFAIVALSRHKDLTAVRYARKWVPVNGKIPYRNPADKYDTDYPEGALRWLCKNYNVVIVAYDEYQLYSFCEDLAIEGIAAFEVFKQQAPRLVADKALYDCIRDRRIIHDGTFPDLREHLANASSTAEDQNTLRIVKSQDESKIDLAVAASMANDRARFYLPE